MEKKRLTTEEDYRLRVERVANYIREHLDSEVDIRTLAELSAFSPFHFHRIMRGYLGEPIGAFIVRSRVGAAYDKIYGELLAKNGVEPRSNYCMEKYVSDPRCTAPEKSKTEIYIPIE